MTLERASWIAGIVGTIFAVFWGIWLYIRPPESSLPLQPTQPSINGSQNVLIQGNNNVVGTPSDSAPRKGINPESALATLTTGISRTSLEAQFGPAKFDETYSELSANNLVFVFPRFFLQAVISREDKVVFYSVTTRSTDFRPSIPKLGGQLLSSRFSDFGEAEHVYSYMTSKYYAYAEKIYRGNAGNYRNFYLGYCPAGAPPVGDKFVSVVLEHDGLAAHKQFRAANAPNCFGVGDILGDEDQILEKISMGINYFAARDLL